MKALKITIVVLTVIMVGQLVHQKLNSDNKLQTKSFTSKEAISEILRNTRITPTQIAGLEDDQILARLSEGLDQAVKMLAVDAKSNKNNTLTRLQEYRNRLQKEVQFRQALVTELKSMVPATPVVERDTKRKRPNYGRNRRPNGQTFTKSIQCSFQKGLANCTTPAHQKMADVARYVYRASDTPYICERLGETAATSSWKCKAVTN